MPCHYLFNLSSSIAVHCFSHNLQISIGSFTTTCNAAAKLAPHQATGNAVGRDQPRRRLGTFYIHRDANKFGACPEQPPLGVDLTLKPPFSSKLHGHLLLRISCRFGQILHDQNISKPTICEGNVVGSVAHLPAQPCHVPCDDGHGHCKLLEYQAPIRITIRELSRGRKATQCCSITQCHAVLQLKNLEKQLFQLEGLCGKDLMHIVNCVGFHHT